MPIQKAGCHLWSIDSSAREIRAEDLQVLARGTFSKYTAPRNEARALLSVYMGMHSMLMQSHTLTPNTVRSKRQNKKILFLREVRENSSLGK